MLAKQHRNSPDASDTDKGINDPCHSSAHAAEDRCDKIELENADKSPVQSTDYDKN